MNFCRPGKSLRASPSTALSFLLPICPLLTCIFNPSTALSSRTVSSYSFRSLPICDNRYLSQSGRLLLFYANRKFLLLSLPFYLSTTNWVQAVPRPAVAAYLSISNLLVSIPFLQNWKPAVNGKFLLLSPPSYTGPSQPTT